MNEQTRIELLKIATELTVATINKFGVRHPSFDAKTPPDVTILFGECVEETLKQYHVLELDKST